jgi:hypothetical protein
MRVPSPEAKPGSFPTLALTTHVARTALLLALVAPVARAQDHDHGAHGNHGPATSPPASAEHAAHSQMVEAMTETPHMRLTPVRDASAADSARAAAIADTLRRAIEKYRDVKAAEADGYRQFAPGLKVKTLHFTKWGHAFRNNFGFDAARPTSLLYERRDDGTLVLTGAMYTASKRASLDDLNARVPLSIARWHLHTNFCVPKRRERERWRETRDGKPVFGPASPIATADACEAVDGKFHETVFNWMVHANVLAGGGITWGDDHQGAGHSH